MNDLHVIERVLIDASKRRRLFHAWEFFWRGALVASLIILLALAGFKFLPFKLEYVLYGGAAALLLALLAAVARWSSKPTLLNTARWLDQRAGLRERLSTAWEACQSAAGEGWIQVLVADAAQHAGNVDAKNLLSLRLPKAASWCVLVLAVSAGLGFVPEYRSAKYLKKEQEARNVQDVAQHLNQVLKHNLATRPPALEPTQKLMSEVTDVGENLLKGMPARTEALKAVNDAVRKIEKDLASLEKDPGLRRLENAARKPTPSGGSSGNTSDLQRKLQELEKKLGDAAGKEKELAEMKEKLKQAKNEAKGLSSKDSPAGAAAREQLAKALSELSQQAKNMGQPVAGLEEAIEALRADRTDLFVRDLNNALEDLEKLQQMAQSLQKMQQEMAGKLGKDLAEQLQHGQAEAASNTLKKMVEQLQKGGLSPQQVQDILKEVSQAIKPAAEYGKVAESLDKAAQAMGQKQNGEAARNLAEAAKELDKLMQQMGDANSMADALDALKRAGVCLSEGQGWGRGSKPCAGDGGKPGRGVGTWAEETGWLYYPQERQQAWDNSGLTQADREARGITERDVERPDNLTPTKIKGKIAPGSSMPSITLKGVSIRGQSSVGYQEAVQGAQSEAESALNQDQVPRAYRGSVKDYFDDLKP